MKQTILSLAIFFLISIHLFAQEAPKIKFGKVSEDELKMTVYEPDTAAPAVILYDDGQSDVKYDVTKNRFMLTFNRFLRIKILKQSGTEWGNFVISLYSSAQSKEDLNDVDGTTFNMENGKIEKSVMKKDAIFHERENKYWETTRLSLPSVKVGSVIDLKYTIQSPLLWNLRTWKFQYSIPVKWSQYNVSYPEYFTYNQSSLGYHRLNSRDESTKNENINITETYTTAGSPMNGGGQREKVIRTISYMANIYKYSAIDVPAMKEEPYTSTLENYVTRVKFELANTNFSKIGGDIKSYTNSWTTICDELLSDADFGGQINGGNFIEDVVKELISGKTTQMDKTIAIYEHLQNTVKWDEFKSYMPSGTLKKAYSDKTGNSADLNLLLLVMLQKAGIQAFPVLLSTRDHGILSPVHATLSDCNYVIVKAIIDDSPVLLDVTDNKIPAGQLPLRCMNGDGIVVRKDTPEETSIATANSINSTSVILEMNQGKLSGNLQSRISGLNAYTFRQEVKKAGGEKEYFENLKNKTHEIDYLAYSYKRLDSLYLPVEKRYDIAINGENDGDADVLYVDPIISGKMSENPFTLPTRNYPVDFGIPFTDNYKFSLVIPEGYKVEELPKNRNIVLGEKAGRFIYTIGQMDNRIILNMRFSIDKSLFLPEEYPTLKEFFDLIVAKEAEQIIFKKL